MLYLMDSNNENQDILSRIAVIENTTQNIKDDINEIKSTLSTLLVSLNSFNTRIAIHDMRLNEHRKELDTIKKREDEISKKFYTILGIATCVIFVVQNFGPMILQLILSK